MDKGRLTLAFFNSPEGKTALAVIKRDGISEQILRTSKMLSGIFHKKT